MTTLHIVHTLSLTLDIVNLEAVSIIFFESKSRKKATSIMRRKSKKVQADFNAIIEAKMISKAQALVDKAKAKHFGLSLVMGDFPVPLDLDATKLVQEVVASVKKETLSIDCGSITDEVETVRTFDDPDKKDAEIIKLKAHRDALLDRFSKKSRSSDTTDMRIKILKLCETVCEDRYPYKVRQGDFLESKELLNILDEANCELTEKKVVIRPPKPKRKKKGKSDDQPRISVCTIQKVVREVNKARYPNKRLLGRPKNEDPAILEIKTVEVKKKPRMVSTDENDWSSKSAPNIVKAINPDLN